MRDISGKLEGITSFQEFESAAFQGAECDARSNRYEIRRKSFYRPVQCYRPGKERHREVSVNGL